MSLDATGCVGQSSKPYCVIDALLVRSRFAVSKKQWSWGIVGLVSCLSCFFVVTIACDQDCCLLQEAGEHALIRHVWKGRYFGWSGMKGLQLQLIERLEALNG